MPVTFGETTRHFYTRVREHLVSDKASHVYKHIAPSQAYRESCSRECFTVPDTGASGFQLKIKEAMYIKWNQQVKHVTFHVCWAVIFAVSFSLFIVFFLSHLAFIEIIQLLQ